MKKNSILTAAILIVLAFGFQPVFAQITITIPKIPKFKKDKPKKVQAEAEKVIENNQPNNNQSSTVTESKDNQANSENQAPATINRDDDKCTNYWVKMVIDDLTQIKEDFDTYTPNRGWLYTKSPAFDYMLFTVSPRARQNWLKDRKDDDCPSIHAAFDKLAPSAAKVLAFFVPNKNNYPIQNPATNNLIKSKIGDLANHKIFYVGVKQANWLIEKNDIGIPIARYKHGIAWVRYTPDDHQYCRLYYINIVSDYAGGGTYGASYGNYINTEIVPCPAGTK